MTVDVKFTCPQCGKSWIEQQDPTDEQFKLGTSQTLCKGCAAIVVRRLKKKWKEEKNEILSRGSRGNR